MDFYYWLASINSYSGVIASQIDQLRTVNEIGNNLTVVGILFALVLGLAWVCKWLVQKFYSTLLTLIEEKREQIKVLTEEKDKYREMYHESERRRYKEAIDVQKDMQHFNERYLEHLRAIQ